MLCSSTAAVTPPNTASVQGSRFVVSEVAAFRNYTWTFLTGATEQFTSPRLTVPAPLVTTLSAVALVRHRPVELSRSCNRQGLHVSASGRGHLAHVCPPAARALIARAKTREKMESARDRARTHPHGTVAVQARIRLALRKRCVWGRKHRVEWPDLRRVAYAQPRGRPAPSYDADLRTWVSSVSNCS